MQKKIYKNVWHYLTLILFLQVVSFIASKFWNGTINNNLFFGLFGNNLLAIIISVIFLLTLFYIQSKMNYLSIFVVMIISGAISNIIDRFMYGGSVDYISIFKFPTFNFADILIVAGCFGFVYSLIFVIKKSPI